jgi:hypothetical protein
MEVRAEVAMARVELDDRGANNPIVQKELVRGLFPIPDVGASFEVHHQSFPSFFPPYNVCDL